MAISQQKQVENSTENTVIPNSLFSFPNWEMFQYLNGVQDASSDYENNYKEFHYESSYFTLIMIKTLALMKTSWVCI